MQFRQLLIVQTLMQFVGGVRMTNVCARVCVYVCESVLVYMGICVPVKCVCVRA